LNLHHATRLKLRKSLHIIIVSTLLVSIVFVSTIVASKAPSVGEFKASKSFDLTGVWTDKWRDQVHMWHDDGKLVGAYTWQGTPAAIIGLVQSDSVTLRYYQAIGHSGEARCFVRKHGNRLDCEYLSHDGKEQGAWVMRRIHDDKAL